MPEPTPRRTLSPCEHPDGWSARGLGADLWQECWLCGEQRDKADRGTPPFVYSDAERAALEAEHAACYDDPIYDGGEPRHDWTWHDDRVCPPARALRVVAAEPDAADLPLEG